MQRLLKIRPRSRMRILPLLQIRPSRSVEGSTRRHGRVLVCGEGRLRRHCDALIELAEYPVADSAFLRYLGRSVFLSFNHLEEGAKEDFYQLLESLVELFKAFG
jgi:hypothetical protein